MAATRPPPTTMPAAVPAVASRNVAHQRLGTGLASANQPVQVRPLIAPGQPRPACSKDGHRGRHHLPVLLAADGELITSLLKDDQSQPFEFIDEERECLRSTGRA